ncbi:MAG: OmpA family protein [Candidatus Thiodiazotropha sp.]
MSRIASPLKTSLRNLTPHFERTQNITENFLSAIDEVPLESLDDFDSLDSDWLIWKDESHLHTERQSTLPQVSNDSKPRSAPESDPDQQQKRAPGEAKSSASLPSAEDIWKGSLDSMDLGSVFSEAGNDGRRNHPKSPRQANKKATKPVTVKKSSPDKKEPRLSSSADPEHRWGGVWFMSSETSSNVSNLSTSSIGNSEKGGLPSVSLFNSTHGISVDENLSMPSLWVDGCPEINAGQEQVHHAYPGESGLAKKVKRSLLHVAAWVAVGGLIMLMVRLFPDAFGRLWHEVEVKFLNERTAIQESSGPFRAGQLTAAQATQGSALVEPVPDIPKPDMASAVEASRQVPEIETNLELGDPDVNSYENIALATRYFVYFDFNKFTIPTQYIPLLKSVQYKMLLDENTFLKITGYADPQGNKSYNDRLSLKRAEEVKQFFLQRGVDDARLRVTAVGAVSPESGQNTLDERRGIRRVEVILFPN